MTPELRSSIKDVYGKVSGWLDKPERPFQMAELVLETKPAAIVEIGVYGGQSFFPMALAMQSVRRGTIYGIDPWDADIASQGVSPEESAAWWVREPLEEIHTAFMNKLRELGLSSYAVIIRSTAYLCVPLFQLLIDILHIDGSHSEEAALLDVKLYVPKVREGGYIWLDDTHFESLKRAIEEIEKMSVLVEDYKTYRLYRKQ